jgi:hypothetical protein
MESNSLQRRQGLEEKVPELERTIGMVEMLRRKKVGSLVSRSSWLSITWKVKRGIAANRLFVHDQEAGEPFDTTFELSDTLYATGEVDQVDEVYIWLGVGRRFRYIVPLLTPNRG